MGGAWALGHVRRCWWPLILWQVAWTWITWGRSSTMMRLCAQRWAGAFVCCALRGTMCANVVGGCARVRVRVCARTRVFVCVAEEEVSGR